jgi:hypothetical protein
MIYYFAIPGGPVLNFDPSEPFPNLEASGSSYSAAQSHSQLVDSWLGLQTELTEKQLSESGCRLRAPNSSGDYQVLWIGLARKSLLTPYSEIRNLLQQLCLKPGETVVDLGAGYGRMGFVINRHYPDINFIGYEYVGERVREGERCLKKLANPDIKLIHADLSASDFAPASAQYYFIYDYGSTKAIEKTLHDLRRIAKKNPITVVGRGRSSRDTIERNHPWLSGVINPLHGPHYSIYKSAF